MGLNIDGSRAEENISKVIHYPKCWDTVAYPTLAIALWEMIDVDFANKVCPTCDKLQNYNQVSN